MMHEYVAQDRQFAVDGSNLAEWRLKRGAEALQRGRVVELGNLEFDLVADKFAFEIWDGQRVS